MILRSIAFPRADRRRKIPPSMPVRGGKVYRRKGDRVTEPLNLGDDRLREKIEGGYIHLARRIVRSSLWSMPSGDRILALTCLLLANHSPRKWFDGVKEVSIGRGEFITSIRKLADLARLDTKIIRRALNRLIKPGVDGIPFMKVVATARWTKIIITKYGQYQLPENYFRGRTSDDSSSERPTVLPTELPTILPTVLPTGDPTGDPLQTRMIKKEKKEKKEKKTKATEDSTGFDLFWTLYPRKESKARALLEWSHLFRGKENPDLLKRILAALDVHRGLRQWTKDDGQFIPHPSTWLHQRRYDDDVSSESRVRGANSNPQKFGDAANGTGYSTESDGTDKEDPSEGGGGSDSNWRPDQNDDRTDKTIKEKLVDGLLPLPKETDGK